MASAILAVWTAWIVAGAAGCRDKKGSARRRADSGSSSDDKKRGLTVAKIGDREITVGELTDELNRQSPYIRMRFSSPERKKQFLENMLRFEVLVAEAKRRGLQKHPEVQRRFKRAMVDKLIEQLNKELVKTSDISDADIRSYYKQHIGEYRKPERVRISLIVVDSEAEARKLRAKLRAKPGDVRYFSQLAAKHGGKGGGGEKAGGGDEGGVASGEVDFFARDTDKLPKSLVEAAFSIEKMWGVAGPIKSGKGYAILMKTGYREPTERSLEAVGPRIKNVLYAERRMKALDRYVTKLRKRAKIEIDKDNLAKVQPKITPGPMPGHSHR